MIGNYILLQAKLEFIRNFLDHVIEESGAEYQDILRRAEEGEVGEVGDLEHLLDYPMVRQEIAVRAVYYELNALIESELHASARQPWLESRKHKGPKVLADLESEDVGLLRMVEDLGFGDILKLIGERYGVRVDELEGAETFFQFREAVNAFKHRRGFVDFRKQGFDKLTKRHQADVEKAYEAIDQAYVFIKALWKATDREPVRYADSDLSVDQP